jgi:XTP/dITP diphosphohydrolase
LDHRVDVRKIILASNNRHKIIEIQSLLGSDWRVLGASDVAPGVSWDETGDTFLENARIKVKALRPHTRGLILADDSGLCVDALDGAPGVHSSCFGGVEGDHARNTKRLLEVLKDVPETQRTCHFYCLLLLVDEKNREFQFEGRCQGKISYRPTGTGGFGYDPLFIPEGYSKSLAECTASEKNAISHRGLAMVEFKAYLLNV